MKTTIYEKYLDYYISKDDDFFENGQGYGCGVGINKIKELKGEWTETHKLNYAGRYMFIGSGNGYLTGCGDDNYSEKIYFIENIKEDFFLM